MNAVIAAELAAIRRPGILIRAARAGAAVYHRNGKQKRLPRVARTAHAGKLATLLAEENRLETKRTGCEANYSVQEHVLVLTELIIEARAQTEAH